MLKEFDGRLSPSQMEFKHSPFWVQMHDMPLLCMTSGVGQKIGSTLGEFVAVDIAGDGGGWGRCLRIQVILNLTKSLEEGVHSTSMGKLAGFCSSTKNFSFSVSRVGELFMERLDVLIGFDNCGTRRAQWHDGGSGRELVIFRKSTSKVDGRARYRGSIGTDRSSAAVEGSVPIGINCDTKEPQALCHTSGKCGNFRTHLSNQMPNQDNGRGDRESCHHDSTLGDEDDLAKRKANIPGIPFGDSNAPVCLQCRKCAGIEKKKCRKCAEWYFHQPAIKS